MLRTLQGQLDFSPSQSHPKDRLKQNPKHCFDSQSAATGHKAIRIRELHQRKKHLLGEMCCPLPVGLHAKWWLCILINVYYMEFDMYSTKFDVFYMFLYMHVGSWQHLINCFQTVRSYTASIAVRRWPWSCDIDCIIWSSNGPPQNLSPWASWTWLRWMGRSWVKLIPKKTGGDLKWVGDLTCSNRAFKKYV